MPKAIITQGISASGKTTWANEFCENERIYNKNQCAIVCRDDIRKELSRKNNKAFLWKDWDFKHEKTVTDIHTQQIIHHAGNVTDIVIADTNLNKKYYNNLIGLLESCGYTHQTKTFHISFEEACRRDAERYNGVGYSVIAKQYENYLKLTSKEEPYSYDKFDSSKKSAIIVDLDGTLAKNITGRSPYDWMRTGEDGVHEHVKEIINNFSEKYYEILVVSGRDEICRKVTEDWLSRNNIDYDKLFMRTANDHRDDIIVKKEIFDGFIKPHYQTFLVIDDRPKVCRMFRSLGLTVMQCGNPYIEF